MKRYVSLGGGWSGEFRDGSNLDAPPRDQNGLPDSELPLGVAIDLYGLPSSYVEEAAVLGIFVRNVSSSCPWCRDGHWIPFQGPSAWKVEQLDPLTLSPSLAHRCCGAHGYIQLGRWVPV